MVEKPWGKDILPAPFLAPEGKRIGEIWFEPPPEMQSILVKYIFTSEKLSVQVHPNDTQARELGETDRGKEECWLVIDAAPDATLGIGFKQHLNQNAMRQAALDGTIEDLMTWLPVKAGDFFYIPAGTVHAIGAGVSLIEIQQNSNITYRLYDYGRDRELHLDSAIAVAQGEPYDLVHHRRALPGQMLKLADGPYFRADLVGGIPDEQTRAEYDGVCLIVPVNGDILIDNVAVETGMCGLASSIEAVTFSPQGSSIVVTSWLAVR